MFMMLDAEYLKRIALAETLIQMWKCQVVRLQRSGEMKFSWAGLEDLP